MSQTALFKLTIPVNAEGTWTFGNVGLTSMVGLTDIRMAANAYYPGTVDVQPDPANTATYNAFTIEFPTVYQPDTTGMGMVGYEADGTPILPVGGTMMGQDGEPVSPTVEILRRNVWEPEVMPEPETPPQE